MSPNIEVAVQYALAQTGKPYHAYGARMGPDYFDCSGLVIASLGHAGVPLPYGISVEHCWGNTVSLYNWARDVGGLVSVAKAVATRGAILIKGKWYGNGPLGHTSFSLGDGREMAAHGYRSGIHSNDVYGGRNYQDGFIIPGVRYPALEPSIDPEVLAFLAKVEAWKARVTAMPLELGNTSNDVTILNNLLMNRALMARIHKSNTYTKYTRAAVHRLKVAAGFPNTEGRVFGGLAAAELLNPQR